MNDHSFSELIPEFDHSLLNDWYSRGSIRRINGNFIFTIDESEDTDLDQPAIVLIHGFPTSSWDWELMMPSLKKKYRVLCLDMLGFGFSDKPDRRNYTIHKQADLVEQFVREQGVDKFHVLAHDYGVSVAQELIARQLDKTGHGEWLSCSFLNGGLFPETHNALLIQKLLLSPLGGLVNRLLGYKQFKKSFSSVFGSKTKPSEEELKAFWDVVNFYDGKHVFSNCITYMNDRITHRERWLDALQNSLIPLSLINGSVDPVSGKHLVARYKELNCRLDHLCELEDIGHYPQFEAPNRVSEAYLNFIDNL